MPPKQGSGGVPLYVQVCDLKRHDIHIIFKVVLGSYSCVSVPILMTWSQRSWWRTATSFRAITLSLHRLLYDFFGPYRYRMLWRCSQGIPWLLRFTSRMSWVCRRFERMKTEGSFVRERVCIQGIACRWFTARQAMLQQRRWGEGLSRPQRGSLWVCHDAGQACGLECRPLPIERSALCYTIIVL